MNTLKTILIWLLNSIWTIIIIACIWLALQIFLFTSFRIPSDSMEPVMEAGDCILVNKLPFGARLFDIFASMRDEQVEIYRIPGFRKADRNDVLVFNFPHPNDWNKIEIHIMKYYIKRCIGLPGDTLSIRNGLFHVSGNDQPLGNISSQKRIGAMKKEDFPEGVYNSFPYDSIFDWNIKNFGPLYIPKAGDVLPMDRTYFALYRKLIEWEQNGTLDYQDATVLLNRKPLYTYCFQKNYYFVAGDKGENSQDSRYWGLLPEEYIVGKATFIWKSVDPYTGKFRWKRFIKTIQ